MWHPGRNTNHVSRGKPPPDAALNCAIALFMRTHRLAIHQSAAQYQGCRSRLHEEDINLGFVPLGRAVSLPVHQHGAIVRKIRQQLHAKRCGSAVASACILLSKCFSDAGVHCSNPAGAVSCAPAASKRITTEQSRSLFHHVLARKWPAASRAFGSCFIGRLHDLPKSGGLSRARLGPANLRFTTPPFRFAKVTLPAFKR